MLSVREVEANDLPSIHEIYAHHVRHGIATFEEVPPTIEELARRLADVHSRRLPYLVALLDGCVAGYAYAAPFRERPAYRYSVEDSVYVHPKALGRGAGSALLAGLLARCQAGPYRQMIAVIGDSDNHGSIALHRKFGFAHVGTLRAVGFKLGRWVDTVTMQRALGDGAASPPSANGQKT